MIGVMRRYASHLTVATVRRADEAIRILKRLRRESDQSVRRVHIAALKQLVADLEQGELDQTKGMG